MVKRRLLLICAIVAVTLACWVPTADAWWGYRSYGCGWSGCYTPCCTTECCDACCGYSSCSYGGDWNSCGTNWSYRPVNTCVTTSCCDACSSCDPGTTSCDSCGSSESGDACSSCN